MAKPAIQIFYAFLAAVVLTRSVTMQAAEEPALDKLFETGKALFDQFAPEEIKEQYEFPSKAQWDEFAARLQRSLESEDLSELLVHEEEARTALQALRAIPGYEDYADWLEERIDYIEAAQEVPEVTSETCAHA